MNRILICAPFIAFCEYLLGFSQALLATKKVWLFEQNFRQTVGTFPTLPLVFALCYLIGMKAKAVVVIDPEIMTGRPCFADTRVPAHTLIDCIEGGDSLDAFLEDFPTVTRKQAIAFLEEASDRMLVTG